MNNDKKAMTTLRGEKGVTAVLTAIILVMLLGFAALAIDIGHFYVVRNELQNAADAGALAGARDLYNSEGTLVNDLANKTGFDAAKANDSVKIPVDVHWTEGNVGDVERGHWSFATRTFTPSALLDPPDLEQSTEALDADLTFINAVRVKARREDTPVAAFFSRIFGYQNFRRSTDAVAYLGFSGTLEPWEANEPILICKESILTDGAYSCNIGRMINNGGSTDTSQTGAWTNFQQGESPAEQCAGTDPSNNNNIRDIIQPRPGVCGDGNPTPIVFGLYTSATNGELENAFSKLRECWRDASVDTNGDNIADSSIDSDGDGKPDRSWSLTLPVVECDGSGPTCKKIVGAVNVNVVWITDAGQDPQYNNVPLKMDNWTCSTPNPSDEAQRIDCWNQFVSYFNLRNADGTSAPYAFKSLYFKPDCTPHIPTGNTGGENFGILAKIPVLVK